MEWKINSKFYKWKWDDEDGNKHYWEFYYGKFFNERRNGLGTYRYKSIYENGKTENKINFSGHHKKKVFVMILLAKR